jgi:hypothetical protein
LSPWLMLWLAALALTLLAALGFEVDRRRDAAERKARAKDKPKPEEQAR